MMGYVRVRLVNGLLRVTDERMSTDCAHEGVIGGESCPREGVMAQEIFSGRQSITYLG
jgi:hypothetical protein